MQFEKGKGQTIILDDFDKHALNEIEERKDQKGSYTNTFYKLYDVELSETEARKELRGVENHLAVKQEKIESGVSAQMPKYKETLKILADGSRQSDKSIWLRKQDEGNTEALLEAHGFTPTNAWDLINASSSAWNNGATKDDGSLKELYSSKVTVKPKIVKFDIEWIKDVVKDIKPLPKLKPVKQNNNGKVAELQYADIHIGLRGLDYEDELHAITDRVIATFKDVETFILPIGQDWLNINHFHGSVGATAKGTLVEQTLSYEDTVKSGQRVAFRIIDRILDETNANIDCLYVNGNHDPESTYGIFQACIQRYRNNLDRVKFDDSMEPRKYRQYGVNGIGFGHGDEEGKRIFGLFPVEAPLIFANTKYREFHLTHLHQEIAQGENGVLCRRMPTVNEADKWHTKKGFIGSIKRIQCFVYDKECGLEIKYFYVK